MRLLRRLTRFWRVVLLLAGAWLFAGSSGVGAVLLLAAAVAGLSLVRRLARSLGEGLRHADLGHRFLCPRCLDFGSFRFACSACRKQVEASGALWPETTEPIPCPHCGADLRAGGHDGEGVQAFCRCGAVVDERVFHERQVCVLGVLTRGDLEAFQEAASGVDWTRGEYWVRSDDGRRMTYVLDLSALPPCGPRHASRAVEALWADSAAAEATRLRKLLRAAAASGVELGRAAVFIRAPQPPAEVTESLASWCGCFRPGVPAEALRSGLRPRRFLAPELHRSHVTGVLCPEDFSALWNAMDEQRRWVLGKACALEEGPDLTRYVVDLSSPDVPRIETAAHSARQVETIWIGGSPEPLRLGRAVDALFRTWDQYGRPYHRVTVCVEAGAPEPAARHLLDARFGSVQYGVPPRRFLSG